MLMWVGPLCTYTMELITGALTEAEQDAKHDTSVVGAAAATAVAGLAFVAVAQPALLVVLGLVVAALAVGDRIRSMDRSVPDARSEGRDTGPDPVTAD